AFPSWSTTATCDGAAAAAVQNVSLAIADLLPPRYADRVPEHDTTPTAVRAIDAYVNVRMPDPPAPWQIQVAEDYFKRPYHEVFRDTSFDDLLATMDRLGVERVVLNVRAEAPHPDVLGFADKRPDRFWLRAAVDPRAGLKAVRELEALFRSHPVVVAG